MIVVRTHQPKLGHLRQRITRISLARCEADGTVKGLGPENLVSQFHLNA